MRLGYISDLHCEHYEREYELEPMNVLVIAGDIHSRPAGFRKTLSQLRKLTDATILCVLGNHEYYMHLFPDDLKDYRNAIKDLKNVKLLEKRSVIIAGVRFLGTTLWSDLSDPMNALAAVDELNDFRFIMCHSEDYVIFNPKNCTEEFQKSKKWLTKQLKKPFDGKTVVITHHSPSPATTAERFKDSPIRFAFHSNMDELIQKHGPEVWIYGHDHESADLTVGNTRLVSYQAGYPRTAGELTRVPVMEV